MPRRDSQSESTSERLGPAKHIGKTCISCLWTRLDRIRGDMICISEYSEHSSEYSELSSGYPELSSGHSELSSGHSEHRSRVDAPRVRVDLMQRLGVPLDLTPQTYSTFACQRSPEHSKNTKSLAALGVWEGVGGWMLPSLAPHSLFGPVPKMHQMP